MAITDDASRAMAALGNGLARLTDRLERAEGLDGTAEGSQRWLRPLIPAGPVKDALSGTWLGHPVHPLLIAVPIGTWLSATLLDLVGGRAGQAAADRLVLAGVVTTVPTAMTGISDWLDTREAERRVGLVHAAGNTAAVALQVWSWGSRRSGHRTRGVLLSLAADALVGATGYLGGHLSYNQGVGVDTTAFRAGPQEWTPVADLAALPERRPTGVDAGGITLVLVRMDDGVRALDARCTHRGGPLQDGELDGDCIVCPWHDSAFRTDDGGVVRGPAVQPQAAYETRVVDGAVEVRRVEPRGQRKVPA